MADDTETPELDLSDADAEKLLADDTGTADEGKPRQPLPEPDALGDPGKKAIDAMKAERNSARRELEAARAKLKTFEDQGKTESQRLQEERDSHRSRAEKAEAALKRREVAEQMASEHAMVAQIRAVAKRVTGDTDEDLEADAKELFELLGAGSAPSAKTPQKPKERLRGGSDPDEDVEETDPRKLAGLIPRRQ
jgi:hypothetical protein